jgi:hypothetical protein
LNPGRNFKRLLLIIILIINVLVYIRMNLDKSTQMLPFVLNVIFRFAKKEKKVPEMNPNAFAKDIFNKYFSVIQYTVKSIVTVKAPIITNFIISFLNTN